MSPATLYYQSPLHGTEQARRHQPILYFGLTFRIPRSEHGHLRQLEWEPSPAQLFRPVTTTDGRTLQPITGGAVERIETFDQDTGDLLVMYRIPYIAPSCRTPG